LKGISRCPLEKEQRTGVPKQQSGKVIRSAEHPTGLWKFRTAICLGPCYLGTNLRTALDLITKASIHPTLPPPLPRLGRCFVLSICKACLSRHPVNLSSALADLAARPSPAPAPARENEDRAVNYQILLKIVRSLHSLVKRSHVQSHDMLCTRG